MLVRGCHRVRGAAGATCGSEHDSSGPSCHHHVDLLVYKVWLAAAGLYSRVLRGHMAGLTHAGLIMMNCLGTRHVPEGSGAYQRVPLGEQSEGRW